MTAATLGISWLADCSRRGTLAQGNESHSSDVDREAARPRRSSGAASARSLRSKTSAWSDPSKWLRYEQQEPGRRGVPPPPAPMVQLTLAVSQRNCPTNLSVAAHAREFSAAGGSVRTGDVCCAASATPPSRRQSRPSHARVGHLVCRSSHWFVAISAPPPAMMVCRS